MFRCILSLAVVGLVVGTSSAQFIRVPVVSFRPPVHVPMVHGGSSGSTDGEYDETKWWVFGGIIFVAVVFLVGRDWLRKARHHSAGVRIRIVSVPNGEAPLEVRQAWVGVEFPALNRTPVAVNGTGVLTATPAGTEWGYIVDANVAVTTLAGMNPAAAAWWRANVPNVSVAGAQLVFRDVECLLLG